MSRGQALRRIAPRADVELHRRAIGVPILRRMGTTLTAAVVNCIHGLIAGTARGMDRKDPLRVIWTEKSRRASLHNIHWFNQAKIS